MDVTGLSGGAIAAITASAGLIGMGTVFGIRKLIRMGQFSYHNAKISTMGIPYVKKDEVLPLLELGSVSEVMKVVRGDLAVQADVTGFQDGDRELMRSFHRSVTELWRSVPGTMEPLVGSFIHRLEGEEVKRLLRLLGDRSDPLFPIGSLDGDLERSILGSHSITSALDHIEALSLGRIGDALKEGEVDLVMIDDAIDRGVLDKFREMAARSSSTRRGASAFVDMVVDRYNLFTALRGKARDLPRESILQSLYKPTGTIGIVDLEAMCESTSLREAVSVLSGTNVEKHLREGMERGITGLEMGLDRMLLEGSITLSGLYFSNIGPTIRFLVSREMEVRNLRTTLQAVSSGWHVDRARKMMIFEGVD